MKLTEELIDELRKEAVVTEMRARAAYRAYETAAIQFWEHEAGKRLSSKDHDFFRLESDGPIETMLAFADGEAPVRAVRIRMNSRGNVVLCVNQKTKSGKWGKSEYEYDASWAVHALRRPVSA